MAKKERKISQKWNFFKKNPIFDKVLQWAYKIPYLSFFPYFLDRQTDRQNDKQTLWFIGKLHSQKVSSLCLNKVFRTDLSFPV